MIYERSFGCVSRNAKRDTSNEEHKVRSMDNSLRKFGS